MGKFKHTYKNKLIYVFSMPYETHKDLLKVGEATLSTNTKPDQLVPNCHELNQAAKARIDNYTKTASLQYKLEYTELAIKRDGDYTFPFKDKDVHKVLMNSGIHKVQPNGATGEEWFFTDLETVKHAISAVKAGKTSLPSSMLPPVQAQNTAIEFRDEQLDAIERTIKAYKKDNEMLWYAKMRFGKTLTALEVVRRQQYRRVIIITHRPVVDDGWSEDFKKIFFHRNSKHEYSYERKTKDSAYTFDEKVDSENDLKLRRMDEDGTYFFYFASIQDLRGSQLVGGNYNKNNAVFALEWDLIIIDEAHEGTQTELGDNVIKKLRKKKTKILALSGTPFNLLNQYSEDNVYTWDYVMEQKMKDEWDLKHCGDHNPYADLPKMHIYTYDLGEKLREYVTDEYESKAFNFREFFRVWTQKEISKGLCPKGTVEGTFAHENDIRVFLDLLVKEDEESVYPFSNEDYRDMFRHTLWMIPGVKEAKALSELLRKHPVFRQFGIANVAGEGDTYEEYHTDDALELVRKTIKENPYSITLSCGKLTTGVTVKEWTAVFMLSGSYSTAAAQYMQTIFRVQSAGSVNGKQKTDCFVFDFAPDRTLKVLTDTVHLSQKAGKSGKNQTKRREIMTEFLNYCPVIAVKGSRMKSYSVESMMEQLKQIYAERAVNSGFDDESIYNDELLKLDHIDAEKFNHLKDIIGSSKTQKKNDEVIVNGQGLTDEQVEGIDDGDDMPPVPSDPPTPEQIAEREKKKQAKEARKKAIDILRGISIRMPLLIYGAECDIDEDIDLDRFVSMVDKTSWEEFMPQGVTKKVFADFVKYYDRDVFIAAGKRIRKKAAAADRAATPTKRVQIIAEIFRHFKNPDKETVLTPWRVVNMHMSDTIGGWCFYNEKFEEDTKEEQKLLADPRFVNQGEVTEKIFHKDGKVLEINSKTGLYPLYMAYSFYRQRLQGVAEENKDPLELQQIWKEVLNDNVYVICKTQMAKSITKRTLAGYRGYQVNAHYFDNLVNMLKEKPKQFKDKVLRGSYWSKNRIKYMFFDGIVGNPPYQSTTTGGTDTGKAATQAKPIFHLFVSAAKEISPNYVSMIIPARWYNGGIGLNEFRNNMLNDERLAILYDFYNSKECFSTVEIAGGLCYFLWDLNHKGECKVVNISGNSRTESTRKLNQYEDMFIRSNMSMTIIDKILGKSEHFLYEKVSVLDTFGIPSKEKGHEEFKEGDIQLLHSVGYNGQGMSYIERSAIKKNANLIDKYKVKISIMVPQNGEVGIDPARGYRSISTPQVLTPGTVDTFSYLNVGFFDTRKEAENYQSYLQCKFTRFLIRSTYSSVHISQNNFVFVPVMDFTKNWSDKELYDYFELSDNEIALIETTMRPMKGTSYYGSTINESYDTVINNLLKKYGPTKHNYFKDTSCTVKNPYVTRTAEGLYCHHIDEDKAIMLSNPAYAAKNPFEYQKAERLVYCNLLEHLILHVKIAETPSPDANENELPGIGGAVNLICKELNDIYAGKEQKEEWRIKTAEAVKDDFDDYILILKYLWKIIEANPEYKMTITKDSLCTGFDGKVVAKVLNALNDSESDSSSNAE